MALIYCPECDKRISEHADVCPHCGVPGPFEEDRSSAGCIGFIIVFFIILTIVIYLIPALFATGIIYYSFKKNWGKTGFIGAIILSLFCVIFIYPFIETKMNQDGGGTDLEYVAIYIGYAISVLSLFLASYGIIKHSAQD